ncbi:MAG: hypothetical protein E6R03_15155 [Hyphomicrobiaceae bacterium]|nr:MAG: hypothetical protein E6R03_15155 [Hyphomicrobiaceae bacterium]
MATVTDDFNRGNWGIALGANWTVDNSGAFQTAWEGSAMSIASTGSQWYTARYTATAPAGANYYVEAPSQTFGDPAKIGIGVRLTSSGNGYVFVCYGGFPVELWRLDAWSGTQIGSGGTSLDVNTYGTLKLDVNGSTLTASLNGTQIYSVTDSTYSAAGHWGIAAFDGDSGYGSRLDSFTGVDTGAPAATSLYLPRFRTPLAILAR